MGKEPIAEVFHLQPPPETRTGGPDSRRANDTYNADIVYC